MAKKKSNNLAKYLPFAAILLSILAFVMLFLPAIVTKEAKLDTEYTGFQLAFGYKKTIGSKEFAKLNFSFMNFLTVLLPLAALVLTALNSFGKKQNKLLTLLAAICLAVAGVFFFMSLNFASFNKPETIADVIEAGLTLYIPKEAFKLGIGAILGGVFSLLGALASFASLALDK